MRKSNLLKACESLKDKESIEKGCFKVVVSNFNKRKKK
jgi:hypothetical protein